MTVTLQVTRDGVFTTHTNSVMMKFPKLSITWARICPVRMIRFWSQTAQKTTGPVFTISTEVARHRLQEEAAAVTGLAPSVFGLHSFRAGGATDAEASGKTLSEIMHMGRWKSTVVLQYLRCNDECTQMIVRNRSGGTISTLTALAMQ